MVRTVKLQSVKRCKEIHNPSRAKKAILRAKENPYYHMVKNIYFIL